MNSSGKVLILGASGDWRGSGAPAGGGQLAGSGAEARRSDSRSRRWHAVDSRRRAECRAGCGGGCRLRRYRPCGQSAGLPALAAQVLPMLHNTLQAAEQQRALVVLPGTVYNYGPDAFPLIAEAAPQQPVTRKGAIRVEMEQALEDYVQRGGRALIVRAGDFLVHAPEITGFLRGWSSLVASRVISRPGAIGVGHQWAYLPDVADTIAALLARRHELEPFARFHMQGHWDPDGSGNESGDPAGGRPLWRPSGSEVFSLVAGKAGGAL